MSFLNKAEDEIIENATNEKSTVLEQLREYEKQGYVFHGSFDPNIRELEPRNSVDTDKSNIFNNDTAIFAAQSPTASIIFACMSLSKVPEELQNGTWSIGLDKEERIIARIPKKWQSYIIHNTGYVYVLGGNTFSKEGDTEGGWQMKSKVAIKPTEILTVSFSDFEKLGGVLVWKK